MSLRSLIKRSIKEVFRYLSPRTKYWSGNYSSWEEVLKECRGYEDPEILSRVVEATRKVANGEAIYERDSITFEEIEYSWQILASIYKCLARDGYVNVLDFGGSLGSSYRQFKCFAKEVRELSWNIVEQENFVKAGQSEFSTSELKFYSSIDECLSQKKINLLIASSVLEYLPNPEYYIKEMIDSGAKCIVLDRVPVTNLDKNILKKQIVPKFIYSAEYPSWFFSRDFVTKQFTENGFKLLSDSVSFVPNKMKLSNGVYSEARCFIFEKG